MLNFSVIFIIFNNSFLLNRTENNKICINIGINIIFIYRLLRHRLEKFIYGRIHLFLSFYRINSIRFM